MRLARLGAFHQTRLSFMRQLTRRLQRERWRFSRPVFDIDANGVGHAVLSAHGPERSYSLVAFAHDLPAEQRSDRVIAEAWDATFALFDGVPDEADVARLAANVPRQEAGRVTETELTLSRANRSVRLWEHVVESLASGRQPELDRIDEVGYLMRTTAVYGSGKFGACDRESVAARPELAAPFQVEMLTVYLIRAFVRDLVEHTARVRGGSGAVPLAPDVARRIGIGNSTGLGMAPFIVNHPRLFDHWIGAREEALARVRGVERAGEEERRTFRELLTRSIESAARWHSAHPLQRERIEGLSRGSRHAARARRGASDARGPAPLGPAAPLGRRDLARRVPGVPRFAAARALRRARRRARGGDGRRSGRRAADRRPRHDRAHAAGARGSARLGARAGLGGARADRARLVRLGREARAAPRRALRGADRALRAAARAGARRLRPAPRARGVWPDEAPIAGFLLRHPEHRHVVRRLQIVATAPYAEIRDNTISAGVLPIDMLRAKLSFFGAVHFDPRSDRWVRICLYGNAPYPEELANAEADRWPYPPLAEANADDGAGPDAGAAGVREPRDDGRA